MANEWFCKLAGTEIGPLSPQQLRAMAVKGRLTPDDEVRRGKDGKWSPAGAVGGLFPKADSSPEWADTTEIPVQTAEKLDEQPPAAKPAAKAKPKPAASRAVKPVDLPVARAAPQPPAVGVPTAMPVAAAVNPAARPTAVVAAASKATPAAVGAAPQSGRGGHHGGDPHDFRRRKKEKQKKLFLGLCAAIGALAVAAIVVAVVRSNSADPPAASAEDRDQAVAEKTLREDFGPRPGERAAASAEKTSGAASKTETAKPPAEPEKPAKTDDGWHDAGGPAVTAGNVSVRIASATIVTRSVRHRTTDPVSKKVISESKESKQFLRVGLALINNHATSKLEPATLGRVPPLVDNLGNKYEPKAPVKGEPVYPGKTDDWELVFDRPVDSAKFEFLQLRLPAGAFGAKGTVDFKIPAAMITLAPEKEEPGTRPKDKDDPLGLEGETPAKPKTPGKEPPPKKDDDGKSIKDIEKDIESTGGGDKSRT